MNLPNTISVARIFLTIPVFMLISAGMWKWAMVIFLTGALSDYLDGFLARKLNQITSSGKVLDQISDKVFVSSTMIALIPQIPAWLVALIVARDSVVSAVRILAANSGVVIQANRWGKAKTVLQMLLVILLLFENSFRFQLGIVNQLVIYSCAFFTVVSALIYLIQNRKVLGG
ncbi:CDP-diacylglycerol--glycerol-3-phosphate 3-phosphatidyltransferase [Pseudothermotoga elfii]|jgi:CDP-diacylglycerol--glycerol-3-phosphate 3-phosphatidyltransferase